MSKSFVHLHLHTEYSMLDGAARVQDVVATAAADGQPAIGITDHGNMYGVIDFYRAARDAGLTPVIGTEAYMVTTSRFDRPRRDDHDIYHLTVLAETTEGYRNLIKLASDAYLDGYYYKPRADFELLERHAKGLVATTGCLGGAVSQALLADDYAGATELVERFQSIFGRDSFFVELQDHGLPEQDRVNPQLIRLARDLRAPLLATNDSHYTHRHDAESHAALLCVQTGSTLDDPKRFKFDADEFYLKTAAEMRGLFADYEEACDNTLLIAERANVEIEFGNTMLPSFETPQGHDENSYLRELTFEGAKARYGDTPSAEVVERLDHELEVIKSMGFSAYFLVVWDLYRHARTRGIRVGPGRGERRRVVRGLLPPHHRHRPDPLRPAVRADAQPGSQVDARHRHGLRLPLPRGDDPLRVRALRMGPRRAGHHVLHDQGACRRARLGTRARLPLHRRRQDRQADAAARDGPRHAVARVPRRGRGVRRRFQDGVRAPGALRVRSRRQARDRRRARARRAPTPRRHPRRRGGDRARAAHRVPADPAQAGGGSAIEDSPIVTQYEMHGVEDLGLLKMDFLGLRNLDVLEIALDLVERSTGSRPDIDGVDLDDAKTFELLQRGDTIGVFQLEGGPMRSLLRSLRPTQFEDVAALVALYRPGPMATNMHNDYADRKNGRKPVTYYHADLEEVLAPTYGLMVYQEQLMRVAQRLAGYSLEEADQLRYAAAKKKRDLMRLERSKFVAGCVEQGHTEQFAEQMFGVIEPFADYSFPKAHATGYGLIAYQTAYLKANYPVEYLAALLTSVKTNKDQTAIFLNECRQLGLAVLVPDVNESESDFSVRRARGTATATTTPSGSACRRCATSAREWWRRSSPRARRAGPFVDFYDFCDRVDPSVLNKRTIESLVKAGGFDSLGHPRQGLVHVFETIVDTVIDRRRNEAEGQFDLFSAVGESDVEAVVGHRVEIPDTEFAKAQRLAFEKEMLGLYVSEHPLMGAERSLRRHVDTTLSELREAREGELRTVGGIVTALRDEVHETWRPHGHVRARRPRGRASR